MHVSLNLIVRIMTTKLTLTMEDSIIWQAKNMPKNRKSLSGIVENYFKSMTGIDDHRNEISPKILKLKGLLNCLKILIIKLKSAKQLLKKYKMWKSVFRYDVLIDF